MEVTPLFPPIKLDLLCLKFIALAKLPYLLRAGDSSALHWKVITFIN